MSERVAELFEDTDDFERLLSDAESQAKSEFHQEFVADIRKKYDTWGIEMFLSEKQRSLLEKIVG